MSERDVERWLALAESQIRRGQLTGAIDTLRRVLSVDPDHAEAHAYLALCLLDQRRLHAAVHEAGLALALDPENTTALYASGLVQSSRRHFGLAEEQFRQLLEREPGNPAYYRSLADVYGLTGRRQEMLPLLQKALELAPDDPENLADLGDWHLRRGELAEAERRAREALTLEPEHHGGLILMGYVQLRRGRVDEAREHAVWALRNQPTSRQALYLLAAIKARSNWFLGLWWRYSAWMGTLGDGRAIVVLLAAFVLYRVGLVTAEGYGQVELANYVQFLWLALVAYTWIGPGLFHQSLKKELAAVRLDKDF